MVVFASIDFEMCWKLSFCLSLCINMAMWEWEKLFKMHHPFYWSNSNRHWRLWPRVSACLIKACCGGGQQKQIRQCRLATRLDRESRNLTPAVRWLENYLWEVFCCCILGNSATPQLCQHKTCLSEMTEPCPSWLSRALGFPNFDIHTQHSNKLKTSPPPQQYETLLNDQSEMLKCWCLSMETTLN